MSKVKLLSKVLLIFMLSMTGSVSAQTKDSEILTLFTTQQERELIDRNRYKKKQVKNTVVVAEKPQQEEYIAVEQMEEVTLTVRLTGVAISQSGENVAWLNGKAFENGGKLDDGSKVYINAKKMTQIQIKTPDGKYHSVVAGETFDITYFKRIGG